MPDTTLSVSHVDTWHPPYLCLNSLYLSKNYTQKDCTKAAVHEYYKCDQWVQLHLNEVVILTSLYISFP
jgi:hypothetical protein